MNTIRQEFSIARTPRASRLIAGLVTALLWFAATSAFAQEARVCPAAIPQDARCLAGQDQQGAYYWFAIPRNWNGTLVLHAHGGPRFEPVSEATSLEDLERFAMVVQEGYAWAGSSYSKPGYGVQRAALDTENLRQLFIAKVSAPRRTILHGQSWGGNVAMKALEEYGGNRSKPAYDAVLLTSGLLAPGPQGYDFRFDLRVVVQYYCRNLPRPDEADYPLWMGLPAESAVGRRTVEERLNECIGHRRRPEDRTPAQQAAMNNILAVTRVPLATLPDHLWNATNGIRSITQGLLGNRNPFSNRTVHYAGSSDDDALNRGVARYDADPAALAAWNLDSQYSGRLDVPVVTAHGIDDPTVYVNQQSLFRKLVREAGSESRLLQTFVRENQHSKLQSPHYVALLRALTSWLDTRTRPTMDQVMAWCAEAAPRYGQRCVFDPGYDPPPMAARTYPR